MGDQSRPYARGRAKDTKDQLGPRGGQQGAGGPARRPGTGQRGPPHEGGTQEGGYQGPRRPQPAQGRSEQPQESSESTGRAAHRLKDRRPGGDAPIQQMEKLQLSGSGGTGSGTGNGNGDGDGNGNGNGGSGPVGRGALRGRRTLVQDVVTTRPSHLNSKKGTSGKPATLTANYFHFDTKTDWCLFHYRAEFFPDIDSQFLRKGLMRVHKVTLGGFIFDGTSLFCSTRLQPDPLELFSTNNQDESQVRITLRAVGQLGPTDHHYIQFFNILMRKCLGFLKLQLVGRNFYDANARINVSQFKLELWPGYITSIRQHEQSILMCSDVVFKVMREQTVLDLLNECANRSQHSFKEMFSKAVVGCVVLTDYNNRTYRVDDVDFNTSPISTFPMRNSDPVSYVQYYQQKYNLRIREKNQPLLVSRAKPREIRAGMSESIYLVPELCRLTGLTDEMRANFQLMRGLADHTRVGPDARMDRLMQFSRRLLAEKTVVDELKEWNMKLNPRLVQFPGRVLPEEKIVQGGKLDIKYNAGPQADWTRELRSNPMLAMNALNVWVVICPTRVSRDAQNFVSTLIRAGQGMRFRMEQPFFIDLPDDRVGNYVDALEKAIVSRNPQLVMCIAMNNRSDRYNAIKKKCILDRPVPSQVILAKNLASKGVMSIATKVAIQLNCKIGGAAWTVEVPLSGLMVVGFDVCHDTSNRAKTYGAMVASLDKPFSRYFSAVSSHPSGEELSNNLSINILRALEKYRKYNNGALPMRIVIYRDGVGEGDMNYVYEHEVEMIRSKLVQAYGEQPVKMAFVIVSKRINTRIFLNNNNPPPGTVADDCITMPERYDFYLVSQSVRQGTVSPTSYNIISDNVGLDPDKLQRLTYKLTHLYYNWSGTVRVPAPVQYAHKLAYLVGQNLHASPRPDLEEVLYFL